MKSKVLMFALLILVLVMSSCSSASPGIETQSIEEPSSQDTEEPSEPYPITSDAPQVVEIPDVLYPEMQDGDEVKWFQADHMVMNGEVVSVVQTHDLKVTITLRDGRTLVTFEPVIDEIFLVIENCGEPCADIAVATE